MGYLHIIFLNSPQKCMLLYSLEVPLQGVSNEYSQYMFLWRNKKNINTFWLKKNVLSGALGFGVQIAEF